MLNVAERSRLPRNNGLQIDAILRAWRCSLPKPSQVKICSLSRSYRLHFLRSLEPPANAALFRHYALFELVIARCATWKIRLGPAPAMLAQVVLRPAIALSGRAPCSSTARVIAMQSRHSRQWRRRECSAARLCVSMQRSRLTRVCRPHSKSHQEPSSGRSPRHLAFHQES